MRTLRTLAFLSLLAPVASAFAVDRLVPSQYGTIQAAINAANTGDRVMVSSGFYPERIDMKGKAITLKSIAGADTTNLSPNGQRGAIITCATAETANCIIEGFTLFGSLDSAVDIRGSSPIFRECTFSQNNSERGGAISFGGVGGTPLFDHCRFYGNRASGEGGAAWLDANGGLIEFRSCEFSANDAFGYAGGAIRTASQTRVSLTGCEFLSNSVSRRAECFGGAIFADGPLAIDACLFSGNVATTTTDTGWPCGGAIAANGSVSISSTRFDTNEANRGTSTSYYTQGSPRGGAIWLSGEQSASFLDVEFRSNRCISSGNSNSNPAGGAIYVGGGRDPSFTACVFSGNQTSGAYPWSFGGTLYYESGCNGILTTCTIVDSSAQMEGGAIYLNDGASPRLTGCTLTRCSTTDINGVGGAIRARYGSNAYLDNTVFANCSSNRGGAVFASSARVYINGCSFNTNTATTDGGAIFAEGTGVSYVPAIQFSIFCGNSVGDISGPWSNLSPNSNTFLANCGNDCNANGIPDAIDISSGREQDCNANAVPDSCEADCDHDGIPDACEPDCNLDGTPDACEPDCDGDGTPDACEIAQGADDCDHNGVPDGCELSTHDRNGDGVLDACQVIDFNHLHTEIVPITASRLGLPTGAVCYRVWADVASSQSRVYGFYGDPAHEMRIEAAGGFHQSVSGGSLASEVPCDLSGEDLFDSWLTVGLSCAQSNQVASAGINFANFNAGGGIVTGDGIVFVEPDASQSLGGSARRVLLMQLTTRQPVPLTGVMNLIGENADGTNWQAFDVAIPTAELVDCNGNALQDALEIAEGTSSDANLNGVPDECECMGDVDKDGDVNVLDIVEILLAWGETGPNPADVDQDGVVGTADLSLVLLLYGGC